MKQKLVENGGVPASLLWLLAVIAALSVANLYYNQPLLNRISADLGVSEFTANLIPMTTQIGYALGLLFIIPLGDLYSRRKIIVVNFFAADCGNLLHSGFSRHPLYIGGFAGHRNLFGHTADIYSAGVAVLGSAEQGAQCGAYA